CFGVAPCRGLWRGVSRNHGAPGSWTGAMGLPDQCVLWYSVHLSTNARRSGCRNLLAGLPPAVSLRLTPQGLGKRALSVRGIFCSVGALVRPARWPRIGDSLRTLSRVYGVARLRLELLFGWRSDESIED